MAGALEVQLAGNAYYFGKLYEKPTIGDPIRPVEPEDIKRANRLMYAASILGVVVFGLLSARDPVRVIKVTINTDRRMTNDKTHTWRRRI